MKEKIKCKCQTCDFREEIDVVEEETLLNAVNHESTTNQKQIKFLKDQMEIQFCKNCYFDRH